MLENNRIKIFIVNWILMGFPIECLSQKRWIFFREQIQVIGCDVIFKKFFRKWFNFQGKLETK